MKDRVLKTLGYTLIVPTFTVLWVVIVGCLNFDIPLTLENLLEFIFRNLLLVGGLYTSAFYVFYNIIKDKEGV